MQAGDNSKRSTAPTPQNLFSNPENKGNPALVQQTFLQAHSGPLPHPTTLKAYNDMLPGAADRIIKMAESQSAHREYLEKMAVKSQLQESRVGQIMGFVLGILMLCISGLLIHEGKDIKGFSIILTEIGAIISIFYISKNKQRKNLNEKSDSLKNDTNPQT